MWKLLVVCIFYEPLVFCQTATESTAPVPAATQWLYDAVAPSAKGTVDSVVRIWCKKTNMVGSGFILDSGYVITNHHVIQGCVASDLEVTTSLAVIVPVVELWFDENRDLAAIKPKTSLKGTFKIDPAKRVIVGTELSTWGYPFAEPFPAPLFSIEYLSGFYEYQTEKGKAPVKRMVLNGAVNPGNSGGPLISPDKAIVGVVVAKRILVLPQGLASVLKALGDNQSGMQFTGTQDGKAVTYSESQLTAALLDYYRQTSQVFIGEAIAASELTSFLDEKKIPWNRPSQGTARKTGRRATVASPLP
jgi:S1-C subfamily serine protease